jgi:CheY-like chemotaxis protein
VFDILLVEDNPINSSVAQQVLIQAGHRVVTASNGEAAIVALGDRHFDLVLMDVQMPGMDGLETTAVIRAMEAESGGHIPIFALTAHAMPQHRVRCLQSGMDGYLVKPIHPDELLNAVAGLDSSNQDLRLAQGDGARGVNRKVLLQRIGGDIGLLEEIAGMFLDSKVFLLADLKRALAGRDDARLSYVIHTMTGMFSSVAAELSLEILNGIKALVEAQAWHGAEVEVSRLKGEMDLIAAELVGMGAQIKSRSCASHIEEALATRVKSNNNQVLMEASQ